MSFLRQRHEQYELVGQLCNEDLDEAGQIRLRELLTGDIKAQLEYIRYADLQVAMRQHAESLGDEDFTLLEAQAALDAMPTCTIEDATCSEGQDAVSAGSQSEIRCVPLASSPVAWRFDSLRVLTRHPLAWTAAAAVLLIGVSITSLERTTESLVPPPAPMARSLVAPAPIEGPARLRGAVGARWAGPKLELPEDEMFVVGQRLELVEGLAELQFHSGARVVLQGPAIIQIQDDNSASVRVGRIAAIVPESAAGFAIHTPVADLESGQTEYGAEIDVDGSVVTRVYSGALDICLNHGTTSSSRLGLTHGQGARVDSKGGRAALLEQPLAMHFVRYLPVRESLVNLAEVVAGGTSSSRAYHRGLSTLDGRVVDDYGAPAQGDGQYHLARGTEFVDGVFIPNGEQGPVQVDSIGRRFAGFPATAGECWGGAIMARRPIKEDTLPLIRMEYYGDIYGYVNWLHIASKPNELTPQGYGLIGMHSNSGITFDLHAIRARYPEKKILRFRALVGNLESRTESNAAEHSAEAWVLVDGQLRHHRKGFNRESGAETIEVPLTDRDRFLVLAVTDNGGETAYDWVAFGDAVIEMMSIDAFSVDDGLLRDSGEDTTGQDDQGDSMRQWEVGSSRAPDAVVGTVAALVGSKDPVHAAAPKESADRG
jgi:NPCBM/NEW2 domain